MRIEDRDDFVDLVAQAVIDKIEERERIEGMVSTIVARVLTLQKEQSQAASVLSEALLPQGTELSEENTHAERSQY